MAFLFCEWVPQLQRCLPVGSSSDPIDRDDSEYGLINFDVLGVWLSSG